MKHSWVILTGAFSITGMALAGCDGQAGADPGAAQAQGSALSMKIDRPKAFTASTEGWVLRLDAVTFRGTQHAGLRIFANNPAATADTPTSDPTYLGSISPGQYGRDLVSTGDFVIDLSTLRRPTQKLLLDAATLRITCVPLLLKAGAKPAVTVGMIRLDRIKPSR